ncbi:hypothetical protein [Rhodobacter maris]|uniref:Uncharacterized protein n=1 Tax=Rhodobacter maris TaxID=446682 RepID=A0A285SFL1_9RHOB|nr:hypothetical protein [Rhodobacter maris]SOC06465.1 hypothetical protein SAMN05877831_10525 [Rhodobacter maris]
MNAQTLQHLRENAAVGLAPPATPGRAPARALFCAIGISASHRIE